MEEQSYLYFLCNSKERDFQDYAKYYTKEDEGWNKISKNNSNEYGIWICDECTFNNNASSYRCEICSREKMHGILINNKTKFRIGDLYDVKDIINRWLPAKVVNIKDNYITFHFRGYIDDFNEMLDISNKSERNRINEYESRCKEYGLSRYTLKYNSKESIEKIIKEKKEEEDDKKEYKKYYKGRRIFYTTPDNESIYEFTIMQLNKDNNTVDVKYGNKTLTNIPIDLLDLECGDKREIIFNGKENISNYGEEEFITLNSCRKALKEDDNNMITNITNSFISDLSRCTVYSNEDYCNLNGIEVYA